MNRIHSFVFNGGKLIIYTSETATNPYWNNFIYPFETTNPGDAGYTGTPFNITEENTLSMSNPASFYYIDTDAVTNDTDAVGDANVFTTYDPNWCEDCEGQNMLGTLGPVHAYVHYGAGLIIYNALDKDWMGWGTNTGTEHLEKMWALELMQPWNPSGLPCQAIAPGQLTLEPRSDTNPVGTSHELVAMLVDDLGAPLPGVEVTFTVTGDNPGGGTVDWTNPWGSYKYVDDIESREDGGTPGFLQTFKAALATELKEQMVTRNIFRREQELVELAFREIRKIPSIKILADNVEDRLGVISFYHENIHFNLIAKLLSDKFGIQVRGGCACAGTYGHFLLEVSYDRSKEITDKINHGDMSEKPGWVRWSLHPTTTDEEVRYFVQSLQDIILNIDNWEKEYIYLNDKNEFVHRNNPAHSPEYIPAWFSF